MSRLLKSPFGLRIEIDGPVGKAGGNARGDVGIVQFALRIVSGGKPGPFGSSGGQFTVPGQTPIGIDGIYGPQTKDYIEAYQDMRRRSPGPGGNALPPASGSLVGRDGAGGWRFSTLHEDAKGVGGQPLVDQVASSGLAPAWLKALFVATS